MSLDLNALKNNFKSILDAANTTTASTDLSGSQNRRVQKILTVNPGQIPVQASWYPFVTMFIDQKTIEHATIARNQSTGRRKAKIGLKVVGAVWNSKITDKTKDNASDDCEKLMENIEEIMRGNPTVNSTVLVQSAKSVTYHNVALGEEAHIRVGVLSFDVMADY